MASFARGAASLIRIGLSTSKTPLQLIHRRGLAGGNVDDASMYERFEQWMKEYGKVYKDSAEMQKRFLIFKHNVEYIESLNATGESNVEFIESFNAVGNQSCIGINIFADLTNEEFMSSYNGLIEED